MSLASYLLFPAEAALSAKVGGKARNLAKLHSLGVNIPAWFVVLPPESIDPQQKPSQAEWFHSIDRALDAIGYTKFCAVRSSAVAEDGAEHSFAGQFESFLYVEREKVPVRIAEVWQSAQSERLHAYQAEKGLAPSSLPAALVQIMIDPECAGVGFSADPVSGERRVTLVSAVPGVGSGIVSGECPADSWRVNREGQIIERHLVEKTHWHRPDPASPLGVRHESVPDNQRNVPVLSDAQVLEVAALVNQAGDFFGRPQDVEWAYAGGKLYLLQSRPVTALNTMGDPGDDLVIWDNSNIVESYAGVTTPLTFSFARRVYESVYIQFCEVLKVPRARLETNSHVFSNMLGLLRGRIYYNLINWYRVLAMLPGFNVNRGFMEQMMGVKEPMPDSIVQQVVREQSRGRAGDAFALLGALRGLLGRWWGLKRQIRDFNRVLEKTLNQSTVPLHRLTGTELIRYYRQLEQDLLRQWKAPILNDFFAMIFFGLLRKRLQKTHGPNAGAEAGRLVQGQSHMMSVEPARRLSALAKLAQNDAPLLKILNEAAAVPLLTLGQLERLLKPWHPAFLRELIAYVDQFGDRCLEELKLESKTHRDHPQHLLTAILAIAAQRSDAGADANTLADAPTEKVGGFHPVFQPWSSFVLNQARQGICNRENLRFARTRVFGLVRRLFLEVGARLTADQMLEKQEDIFYLTVEEILGLYEGTCPTKNVLALVNERRAEFQDYQAPPSPPDRCQTFGPPHRYAVFPEPPRLGPAAEVPEGDQRQGLGCCPGHIIGEVRVVLEPAHATFERGKILVARQTDPGWVLLFPPRHRPAGGARQPALPLRHCQPRASPALHRRAARPDRLAEGRGLGGDGWFDRSGAED